MHLLKGHKLIDEILKRCEGTLKKETHPEKDIYLVSSRIGDFHLEHRDSSIHFVNLNLKSERTALLLASLFYGSVEKIFKSRGINKIKVDAIPITGKYDIYLKYGYKLDVVECKIQGINPEAIQYELYESLPFFKEI